MNLRYSKKFVTALRKLVSADKISAVHAIELFQEHPHHPSLCNHALSGMMAGKRAIAVDHDLRIVFTERGDYEDVTLLDIGGHAEVYRR